MNTTSVRIFLVFGLPLTLSLYLSHGCKKELNRSPTSVFRDTSYYKTEAQLNSALAAVYNSLTFYSGENEGTYSRNLVIELAVSTDESIGLESGQGIIPHKYNYDASHPMPTNCYRTLYEGINEANYLLENMYRAKAVAESTKKRIRGQALFIRAYCHFVLTLYFGDVPLKLRSTQSPSEINFPRTPLKQVFDQVIRDMAEADTLVRTIEQEIVSTRVTKTAVEGILARVCLHAAGRLQDPSYFAESRRWAKQAIDRNSHGLNPVYRQVFIDLIQEKLNTSSKESIWELTFRRDNGGVSLVGERFGTYLSTKNLTNIDKGYSYGQVLGTDLLFDSYAPGDQRRNWNMFDSVYTKNDADLPEVLTPSVFKFRNATKFQRRFELGSSKDKNVGPTHFPLLRYADLLLMFAEADNEVNGPTPEALKYVNQVRQRAFGQLSGGEKPYDKYTDWQISDQSAFRDSIRNERYRELAFEGLRKQDLNRWGTFASRMQTTKQRIQSLNSNFNTKGNKYNSYNWPGKDYVLGVYEAFSAPKHLLQPIPLSELNLNRSMTQNPGW